MVYKEIQGVLVMFTLMTGMTGLGELQSETSDRDPCSLFVTELAWPTWGIPSLPTCVSVFILSDSIGSGDRLVSQQRFRFLVSPVLAWGSREPPACGDALVFVPGHAIVVGHTQAMFRFARRRSV